MQRCAATKRFRDTSRRRRVRIKSLPARQETLLSCSAICSDLSTPGASSAFLKAMKARWGQTCKGWTTEQTCQQQ